MTIATDTAGRGPEETSRERRPERSGGRPRRRPGTRRQLFWVVPLLIAMVGFLAYSLPPYLGLDPSQSRLPVHESFPPYYVLLVTHIFCGSVALVTGCLQMWPWLRQGHPRVHRWSGRLYFFAGCFPAGLAVLVVAPMSSTGLVGAVGNTMLAVLWLPITIAGYRAARQRRYGEHRKWMIRSFALTTSIVVNRVWMVVWIMILMPGLDTTYGGDMDALIHDAALVSIWLSWVVNLLVAEWWLQRGNPARGRARAAAASA